MAVAIVTDAIAPYNRGGKEQWYQELAPRLNRYVDVGVYTMGWWGTAPTTRLDGVSYHRICRYMPLYQGNRRSIAQAIGFAMSCFRLLSVRFDVLVADHMPYLQLFPLKLVALVRRRPLVVTWHEVWGLQQWRRYLGSTGIFAWGLERLATRLPDCIITTSTHTAERLAGQIRGIPLIPAPGGIDLDLALRTEPAAETVDLVSVGRLLAHKRFDLLLDCVALLAKGEQPLTCRIIGDGPERPALIEQARRLGIAQLVDFRHDVATEELLPLVKAGRVFVFPSEREGFGIAALEAIACGIPVITTSAEHNQARHLVPRAARGVVCEPSAPALAAAVGSALSSGPDPPAGRKFEDEWVREYDWGAVASSIALTLNPAARTTVPQFAGSDGHHVEEGNGRTPGAEILGLDTPAAPAGLVNGAHVDAGAVDAGAVDAGVDAGAVEAAGLGAALVDAAPVDAAPVDAAGVAAGSATDATTVDPAAPAPSPTARRPRGALPDLAASVAGVLAVAGLAQIRGVWVAQAAELLLLLSLPGFLLLRATRMSPSAMRGFPLYVPCASIAVIMAAGLSADLIGPGLGVARPLATIPFTVAICAVCAALILVALLRRAPSLLSDWGATAKLWRAWPLLLPIVAWAGATRLNNGDGRGIAIAAVAATGVALMLCAWRAHRWTPAQTGLLVFGAGLALMWGFTLRSHFVYGFDITGEYQTFTQVLHHGRWHASHPHDSYGAMLSLTIFPSTLVAMTGASPLLVLKAIYPCLFALFPVGVYLLAARVLDRRFAYLAVLFILVQTYFFQQLPAIARQEIALLFFVCLVFAMFDGRLGRESQIVLLAVFAIGLALSHYSTTYLTIVVLAAALVLELIRRRLAPRTASVAIVPLAITVAFMGAGAAIWYEPVTNSAQNVSQFFSDLSSKGISPLPNAGGGILHSYLAGNLAKRVGGAQFATLAHNDYAKTRTYVHPLPQANEAAFGLQNASVPGQRVRSAPAVRALDTEEVLAAQLSNLFAAIGALILWLRRRSDPTARGVALLGVATLLFLLTVRLSGTVSTAYNQERAFLQALVPLSICVAWMLQRGSEHRRFGRALAGVFAVALGLMFLTTSGLRGPLVGGGTATNLASQGEDFERYYVSASELAAARWLNRAAPQGQIVSADRYGALRILGATGRVDAVLPVLTPLTIDRNAWVYADTANFVGHRARGEEGSTYALYGWPSFIGEFWNLVYTNGSAAVYVRTH